jgi:hypothetical protein
MTIALTLIGAMLFPIGTLALLLWLTRLEETLPSAVESAKRRPAPPPILAMPVRGSEALAPVVPVVPVAPAVTPVLTLPEQRPVPVVEAVPVPAQP